MRPASAFSAKVRRTRGEIARRLAGEGSSEAVAGGDAGVDLLRRKMVEKADADLARPGQAAQCRHHVLGNHPGKVRRAPEGRQAEVDLDMVVRGRHPRDEAEVDDRLIEFGVSDGSESGPDLCGQGVSPRGRRVARPRQSSFAGHGPYSAAVRIGIGVPW